LDRYYPDLGVLKPKDLVGIPWRVAFALQADGWYLRSDIIWAKPNPMPESVTDRPTKAHEYVFLMSKSQRYFYDNEAVREPGSDNSHGGTLQKNINGNGRKIEKLQDTTTSTLGGVADDYNHSGRNRRTVWTIATEPYSGAHFATYPTALVEPCIKAGTSEKGACPKCGKPWERVTERQNESNWEFRKTMGAIGGSKDYGNKQQIGSGWSHDLPSRDTATTGWQPACKCFGHFEKRKIKVEDGGGNGNYSYRVVEDYIPDGEQPEPVPCLILDPFAGSGTTLLVARELGRSAVGLDLSMSYLREQAYKRLDMHDFFMGQV